MSSSSGGRIYTDRITMNPPVDMPGDGTVNFYAVDADPNGQLDADLGDRAWQIGSTNKWVCNGGTSWSLDDGGGGGGGASGWDIILRPAGPADPAANVYTTWADAYAAAIAIDGEVTLWLDTDGITPVVVPADTYEMANITLKGWVYPRNSLSVLGGQHTLVTSEGTVFNDFINGFENIRLSHGGDFPLCVLTPVEGEILRVRTGAFSTVSSSNGQSVWSFDTDGGAPSFAILVVEPYSVFGDGAGPILELGAFVTLTLFANLAGLQDDFMSTASSATSVLSYGGGIYIQNTTQTGYLGTVNTSDASLLVSYEPNNAAAWSGGTPTTVSGALDQLAEYNPAVGADWDGGPDGLHNAIDRIAAALAVLIPGPIP